MSLSNWISIYIFDLVFYLWILKLGGAELIGDTKFSGIFIFLVTLKWRELSADGIKVFLSVIFVLHTFFFILGIKVPALRAMLG